MLPEEAWSLEAVISPTADQHLRPLSLVHSSNKVQASRLMSHEDITSAIEQRLQHIRDVRRGDGMPSRLPTPDNGRIHGSVKGYAMAEGLTAPCMSIVTRHT
jgi:hypothetical protein